MSLTKVGVLVGLFVLLLAVYAGLEWRGRQVAEREAAAKRLFGIAPDAVTGVRLERPGEPSIRIVKSAGGEWRIIEPRELGAEQGAVGRLVRTVAEVIPERVLEGVDLSSDDYGLAPPRAIVTLETPSGSERLALGADAPVGTVAYARRGNDPKLLLVPAAVRAEATASLFDLREHALVRVEPDRLVRIELRPVRAKGTPVVLLRDGTAWRLEGGSAGRAVDQLKAGRVVDAIARMRMSRVLSEDRSAARAHGLEPPARKAVVGLASGSDLTIDIGDEVDASSAAVVVAGEPGVYAVGKSAVAPLVWLPEDLLAPPPTPTPGASAAPAADASPAAPPY